MRYLALLPLFLIVACGSGDNAAVNQTASACSAPTRDGRNPAEAKRLFDEAAELLGKSDNSGAADLLEQAVKLDPENGEYHARLGHTRLALLRYEDARLSFIRAADLHEGPRRYELNTRAAYCSHKLALQAHGKGDLKAALAHIDDSLRLNPSEFAAHMLRGDILTALTDYPAAVEAYGNAADVGAGDDRNRALAWKGQSQFHSAAYRAAIETFTGLIDAGVDAYEVYGWRAYCYYQIGKKPEATSDFNQAALRTKDSAKRQEYEAALKALSEAE